MSGQTDRRPWLIISRREAVALMQALVELEHSRAGGLTADQRTAGGQIQKQLAWINGHADVEAPSKEAAMERERE